MTVVDEKGAYQGVRREDALLRVTEVQKYFPITGGGVLKSKVGDVRAVESISFDIVPGETLGIVGESGCGKSTAGRTVMKLLDPTGGKIEFEGRDITNLTRKEMVPLRREMQMIFQDPYSSLNPRHTVGAIISAPFKVQGVKPARGVQAEVQDLMARVGLNPEHYNRYPNEFSGGQRQRIGIARAIALRPEAHRLRRAGVRARRVDPGPGRQPARGPAGRVPAGVRLHRPRPVGRPPHLGPDRGHVPRPDHGDRRRGAASTTARCTPTPTR